MMQIETHEIELMVRLFSGLSQTAREELMNRLAQNHCMHCFCDDPTCQCWNDE